MLLQRRSLSRSLLRLSLPFLAAALATPNARADQWITPTPESSP